MRHPHPNREHVMRAYRRYLIGEKRKAAGRHPSQFRRGARSLIHYMDYVKEYIEAKRNVICARRSMA